MKKYLLYFGLTAFLLLLIAAFTNPDEETTKQEDAEEETAKTTATPVADVSEEEVEQEATVLTDETVRIVDIDGPYTNIRATPNGKIIGRVPVDSRIKTARVSSFTSGKWIGIYTAADTKGKVYWENNGNYDHVGYIHRSLLRFVPNKDTHLFRTADGVLEDEIGIVKRGQMCRILNSKIGHFEWTILKIQTPDGNTGWVYPYDDEGA